MKRILLSLWIILAVSLSANRAFASDLVDAFVDQISGEGYSVVSVGRTWLGRVRIESEDETSRRETVFNPLTGELLQDAIVPLDRVTFLSGLSKLIGLNLREGRHTQGVVD